MKQRYTIPTALAVLLLIVLPLFLGRGHATTPPPLIDRTLFFGYPEIAYAQISPDGSKLAFLKPYLGTLNIWVTDRTRPLQEARPVSQERGRPIRQYFWSRDSKHLLYLLDNDGNEDFHLYALEASGSSPARDLTPFEKTSARILCLPKSDPSVIYVGINQRDPKCHDVFRIDIRTGEQTLIRQNDDDIAEWIFDHKGTLRLAMRHDHGGHTQILKVGDTGATPIWSCLIEETAIPFAFHPDGKRLYMSSNKGHDVDLMCLVLIDAETGEEEFVESDPLKTVDFSAPLFCPVTDELIATSYIGDRRRMYFLGDAWKEEFQKLTALFPDSDIEFDSSSSDGTLWILFVRSDVNPLSAYLYDRTTQKVSFLYHARPNLPSQHLATMHPISYHTRDGLIIHGYLTLPPGKSKNLPLIVHPHGGPYARDYWGYNPEVQLLANRGYAVFQMNFRGSTGYGKAFQIAGKKTWGDAMQQDITDGVMHLIQQNIADPKRVAIYGASYGGYATLAGLAFTPKIYAAGVSFVGPSNILTLLATFPPYWHTEKLFFDEFVGNVDNPEDVARLRRQSPLFSAENIIAPLLVVQGANDPRVKKDESDQIVRALYSKGREVEYLVADDEGHGFSKEENRLAFSVALEQFFAKHLGGRCQKEVPESIANKLEEMRVDPSTLSPDT